MEFKDRIRDPEVSVPLYVAGEELRFDPHYDHVHLFRWLGHSIIKVIVEGEGLAQVHTSLEHGEAVAEAAECEPIERETIGRREYEQYQRFQVASLDESWLDGEPDT